MGCGSVGPQPLNPRFLPVLQRRDEADHPVCGWVAASQLPSLRQGSRSVADFSIEFFTLSAESGWEEIALQYVFYAA